MTATTNKGLPPGYNVTAISGHGIDGTRYYFTRSTTDANPAHDPTQIGLAPADRPLYASDVEAWAAAWMDYGGPSNQTSPE